MIPPIVQTQAEFESWLLMEIRVLSGHSELRSKGKASVVNEINYYTLLNVLCRYTDRLMEDLDPVAHDRLALLDVIRNGRSMTAYYKEKD